jgi:hypothetical protein
LVSAEQAADADAGLALQLGDARKGKGERVGAVPEGSSIVLRFMRLDGRPRPLAVGFDGDRDVAKFSSPPVISKLVMMPGPCIIALEHEVAARLGEEKRQLCG